MKLLPVNPFIPAYMQKPDPAAVRESSNDFAANLIKALREVNTLQQQANQAAQDMVLGQAADIHQVMIAAEEANLAMQLTVQIRNKMIEAYQEISRMQI
jgi:flagellar hook-basal body complex protein FliE